MKFTGTMKKNVGGLDIIIRVIAALILLMSAGSILTGNWALAAALIALVLIFTAHAGFCPLYSILGIHTNKIKSKPSDYQGA